MKWFSKALAVQSIFLFLTSVLTQECELEITIQIGNHVAPNQYTAASGLFTFTCNVQGATDEPLTYQWSSTCTGCPFSNATSRSVSRGALRSTDAGIHTCNVTEENTGRCGNGSLQMIIVGAGINVFQSDERGPQHTLPNNSFLIARSNGARFRFVCRSNATGTNIGHFIGLGGNEFNGNQFFEVTNTQPAEVFVSNSAGQPPITATQQGVYSCRIPDHNGVEIDINIGIYPSGYTTSPIITSLIFDTATRSFTCTSTGSPATIVTWMRDGQPLTIDGIRYQLAQRLTNRHLSTYDNVLTIPDQTTDITRFICIVTNHFGMTTTASTVNIVASVSSSGSLNFGATYSLMCTATVKGILGIDVSIEWKKINDGNEQRVPSSQGVLEFTSLRLSDASRYICRVSVASLYLTVARNAIATKNIIIQIPDPSVQINQQGAQSLLAGSTFTLSCTIMPDRRLGVNAINFTSSWTRPDGQMLSASNDDRITISKSIDSRGLISKVMFRELYLADDGLYTCKGILINSSPFITDSSMISSTRRVVITRPPVTLAVSLNTTHFPNVSPYNVFSINCTATVPAGVVAPKTFEWKRRNGTGRLSPVRNGDSFHIANSGLDMLTSTSMLTVTETSPGMWNYQCKVNLVDISAIEDSRPVAVTGPQIPHKPMKIQVTNKQFTSVTIQWIVTRIAFTPETYIVFYGTSRDSLRNRSNELPGGMDFTALDQDYSIQLNDLVPIITYYYTVVADNTHGSTSSIIQNFTTENAFQVIITETGMPSVGEIYTLTCNVYTDPGVSGTTRVEWQGPGVGMEGVTVDVTVDGEMTFTKKLTFSPLVYSEDYVGHYTCRATTLGHVKENFQTVHVILPSPTVVFTHSRRGNVNYAGSMLTLNCTITLPLTMLSNVVVPVNSVIWTGPHGELLPDIRIAVYGVRQLSSGIYTSEVVFNNTRTSDSGTYFCKANASHSSPFINDGVGSNTTTLIIQDPSLVLSLSLNTTRVPNVAPYNIFTIICTASVPLGVVSPKTFQWKRQLNYDCLEQNYSSLNNNNDRIEIVNKDSSEPVSTSTLSVKETTTGTWSYCCQSIMDELNSMNIESSSIIVTGKEVFTNLIASDIGTNTATIEWTLSKMAFTPESYVVQNGTGVGSLEFTSSAKPQQPTNLMSTDVGTETAIVEWTVSSIAFTPESYVVHYGMSIESLLLTSDPVKSGSNFSIVNSKFSTQLSFLSPSTRYYYKVIATNTEYSTVSRIKGFRTQEAAQSDNTPTIVGGAVAGVIVIVIAVSLTVIVVVWLVIKAVRQNQTRLSSAPSQKDISKEIKLSHLTESENQGSADAHYATVKEAHEYEISVGKCAAYGAVGHNSEHSASAEERVYEPVLVTDGF